ncbi:hypothetical protein M413DRAFT_449946 [Hebeloma cylindrosporum]|uniref:Nephrocystin 3-like N-terminal domain-containing protein n=1 Tax=Hebeloma cylindrosporum TaxID=76867 RepID=A0A0C2XAG3_HEBCY|nr:hypothetical protein M413DRAFT_449946 [Hebeloma cylindrosporum h7]
MFAGSRGIQISGGTFTVTNPEPEVAARKGLELLQQKIVPGAFHNSEERYDPPKCHPQTRQAVLQEIMDWVEDMDRTTPFMWLHGPVGAGKSAIEQTIAEICHHAGILAASFFFSRNVPGRNDKSLLITTLAYQLTVSIPAIREQVGCELNDDPHLLSRSLEAQIVGLIIEPIRSATMFQEATTIRQPYLVILDGLDECGDAEAQRYILRVLLIATRMHIPLIFLIASRPEQHLRDCFEDKTFGPLTTKLVLDDKYHPESDIRIFLASKFQEIRETHRSRAHLPQSWPLEEDIDRLVEKSSGQFIYASTVMKFLNSPRHWPPDRLAIIFGIIPRGKSTPFAEMDALYLHILASADENLPKALEIISFLLLFRHEQLHPTPSFVAAFLSYRHTELTITLSDLHSIIAVPQLEDEFPLRFYHASLGDCLLDRSRSGDNFFIDPGLGHRKIAMCIMQNLTNPSGITDSDKQIMRETFPEHCSKSEANDAFIEALYDFNLEACLWRPPMNVAFVNVTSFFRRRLHPLKSYDRVPALLLWLRKQHPPDRENDLLHHHLESIDSWLRWELSALSTFRNPYLSKVAFAGVALVDFPEFKNSYHIIPKILDWKAEYSTDYHDPEDVLSEDWEDYLWYRKLLADFLTDPARARGQLVGVNAYVELAKYIWEFLLFA